MKAVVETKQVLGIAPVALAPSSPAGNVRQSAERVRRHGPVCFEGDIPPFVVRALDELHGSPSTAAPGAGSYVYLRDGQVEVALVYRLRGADLQVLSEGVTLGAHDIAVFAEHMLAHYRQIEVILFCAIDTDLAMLRMPMLKTRTKVDATVNLSHTLYDLAIFRSRASMILRPQAMLRAWSQRSGDRTRA